MSVKDIVTIVISIFALFVSFASLFITSRREKINVVKEECIKLNSQILTKLDEYELVDVYKASVNIGNKERRKKIENIFYQLDYCCTNISIIRDNMVFSWNKKIIDDIFNELSGAYIRRRAEKIIAYCYAKDYEFHGPFSIFKSFGILFDIIDKPIMNKTDINEDNKASYDPQEKYNNAIRSTYFYWKRDDIESEYTETVNKLADICKENFVNNYDPNKDYEVLFDRLKKDYKHLFKFIKGVKNIYKKDSDNIKFPFALKFFDGAENIYVKNIKEHFADHIVKIKTLQIDDISLKNAYLDIKNIKNSNNFVLHHNDTYEKILKYLIDYSITDWCI